MCMRVYMTRLSFIGLQLYMGRVPILGTFSYMGESPAGWPLFSRQVTQSCVFSSVRETVSRTFCSLSTRQQRFRTVRRR